jgi:DNA-binding transcriptional ArsR family regulator
MPKRDSIHISPARREALRRFKAGVFQSLGHPTRIHIAECLGDGEMSVSALQERVGVEPANLSQHLAILRGKGLVDTRREANQIFYSLHDPLLTEVLATMRRYFLRHLEESLTLLQSLS